jgi:hypothetical protein
MDAHAASLQAVEMRVFAPLAGSVKISKVPTRDDCPVTPVKMVSVTIAM